LPFSIASRAGGDGPWTEHAAGVVRLGDVPASPAALDLPAIDARCPERTTGARHYEKRGAVQYGSYFRAIDWLAKGPTEILGHLTLPERARQDAGYVLHPSLMDGALQALDSLFAKHDEVETFLPF